MRTRPALFSVAGRYDAAAPRAVRRSRQPPLGTRSVVSTSHASCRSMARRASRSTSIHTSVTTSRIEFVISRRSSRASSDGGRRRWTRARADIGLPVVEVVVPGLQPFWRRLAPGGCTRCPTKLGWVDGPVTRRHGPDIRLPLAPNGRTHELVASGAASDAGGLTFGAPRGAREPRAARRTGGAARRAFVLAIAPTVPACPALAVLPSRAAGGSAGWSFGWRRPPAPSSRWDEADGAWLTPSTSRSRAEVQLSRFAPVATRGAGAAECSRPASRTPRAS